VPLLPPIRYVLLCAEWRTGWDYSALRASPLRGRPRGALSPLRGCRYRCNRPNGISVNYGGQGGIIRRCAPHPFGGRPKGALSPLRGCSLRLNRTDRNCGQYWRTGWDYSALRASPLRGRPKGALSPLRGCSHCTELLSITGWDSHEHRYSLSRRAPSNSRSIGIGGQGGIRTHEHLLGCYSLSRRAPSTTRPPVRKPLHTAGGIARGYRRSSSASLRTVAAAPQRPKSLRDFVEPTNTF
jgi:hypothetical protein